MKRALIYFVSLCLTLTQVIGQWHAVAHGVPHEVTHNLGAGPVGPAGLYVDASDVSDFSTTPAAATKATTQYTAAWTIPTPTLEHDKQTCLSFDALATALSWISADLLIAQCNTAPAVAATIETRFVALSSHAYWATGPPTL